MNSLAKIIGYRIRTFRNRKGFSQEKLGEKCNLHPNYVGQVERGEKNCTLDTIQKIANGLDIQLDQLFWNTESERDTSKLSEILILLAMRPMEDQEMAYNILKSIFDWEERKK